MRAEYKKNQSRPRDSYCWNNAAAAAAAVQLLSDATSIAQRLFSRRRIIARCRTYMSIYVQQYICIYAMHACIARSMCTREIYVCAFLISIGIERGDAVYSCVRDEEDVSIIKRVYYIYIWIGIRKRRCDYISMREDLRKLSFTGTWVS